MKPLRVGVIVLAIALLVLGATVAETDSLPWTRKEVAVAASTLPAGHRIVDADITVQARYVARAGLSRDDVLGSVLLTEISDGEDFLAKDLVAVPSDVDLQGRVPLSVNAVPASEEPAVGSVATLVLSPKGDRGRGLVTEDVVVLQVDAGAKGTEFVVAVNSADLSQLAAVLGNSEARVVAAYDDAQ